MTSIFRPSAIIIYWAVLITCNTAFAEVKEFSIHESSEQPISEEIEQNKRDGQEFRYLTNPKYLASQTQNTGYVARQFQDRIRENEDEIRFLINEKDWLQERIYHLEDLHEPVPWEMRNSITIKEKKIRAAFRENSRLNELLKQDRYQGMDSGSIDYSGRLSYPSGSCSEALKQKLSQEIRAAGLNDWLHFTGDVKDFCKVDCCAVENVLPILYSSGSSRLANEYRQFLKRLAGIIKKYDVRIRIDGFADVNNIKTKQYPSNFELGATRAANIVHELVKNGVSPSVFRIATTGKYRPDGKPMSGNKSLERRSEIEIVFM